jgi:hypothetical protein
MLERARPAPDRHWRQRAHFVLRQAQCDCVGLDPGDRADRNQHFAPLPRVSLLEHDVGDQLVVVDEEPVDVAEVVAVR